jgi:hypothetical protein
MPNPENARDDFANRGQEFYERHVRPRVEPGNDGRFCVMDIESGDFEVDDDDLSATERLLERHPGAMTYDVRIGRRAAYRI